MATQASAEVAASDEGGLKRTITGRLLFFYVLGDVLGSGIYVLIGAVAGEVGGAFWMAFASGMAVATVTGLAYAELVTKYPRAAGASLFINKAFGSPALTFFVTVCILSALFAASGSLASGFATYFAPIWDWPPALLVTIVFVLLLTVVNFIGITESVVANMVMTFIEVAGLVLVVVIGIVYVLQGNADFGTLVEFDSPDSPVLAVVAGVSLAFFAMTGFENTANVAEETIEPAKCYPRALIGGMLAAGVIYVLVAMSAALVVDTETLGRSAEGTGTNAALLEVIKADVISIPVLLFAAIALVAITNTTLVGIVTQPRILYGMAKEDVVPGVFAKLHSKRRSPVAGLLFCAAVVIGLLIAGSVLGELGLSVDLVSRLASVTVLFLLFIYTLVIIAALRLSGRDETEETFHAPRVLLVLGLLGNVAIFAYSIYDDWRSLLWCAALLAIGLALFVVEKLFGKRDGGEALL
jgi:amino acid transporter